MTDTDTIAANATSPNDELFARLCAYVDAQIREVVTGQAEATSAALRSAMINGRISGISPNITEALGALVPLGLNVATHREELVARQHKLSKAIRAGSTGLLNDLAGVVQQLLDLDHAAGIAPRDTSIALLDELLAQTEGRIKAASASAAKARDALDALGGKAKRTTEQQLCDLNATADVQSEWLPQTLLKLRGLRSSPPRSARPADGPDPV